MENCNTEDILKYKEILPEIRKFSENSTDLNSLNQGYNELNVVNTEKVHSFTLDQRSYAKEGDIFILNFFMKSPTGETVNIITGRGESIPSALQDGIGNIIEINASLSGGNLGETLRVFQRMFSEKIKKQLPHQKN